MFVMFIHPTAHGCLWLDILNSFGVCLAPKMNLKFAILSPTEESRDDADRDSEQDGEKEQTIRRRKRRKKKPALHPDCKKDGVDPANQPVVAVGQAHTHEGGEGVSKNKKRKLKKKRRKEKLLSMGLMPQAAAVEFTYRKDDEGNDESGSRVAEVSDFLRSTMKLYMSDCKWPAALCNSKSCKQQL